MTTAKTILEQLGGNKFLAMTGASNLLGSDKGLSFKIGRNAAKVTHVRVTLTPADEYTVEFIKIRGVDVRSLGTVEHVQGNSLARVFASRTGMDTHL